jgi:hypothetical protein
MSSEPKQKTYDGRHILGHVEVDAQGNGGNMDNRKAADADYQRGFLRGLEGPWVAYAMGVFCGHDTERNRLIRDAITEHGASNLAVFKITPKGPVQLPRKKLFRYDLSKY